MWRKEESQVILHARNLPELRDAIREAPNWSFTKQEIGHMFWCCHALWLYQEPACPERPHVELRNHDHSNFFVNCRDVLKESVVLEALGHACISACDDLIGDMQDDDWVIGAAQAGAPISQEVARLLDCRHATVEKDADGNPTVFNSYGIAKGERVLIVNDLLSHVDGSTYMSIRAIQEACPEATILPVAVHLVNCSGENALADGTPVRSLLDYNPVSYPPDNCPLCRAKSPALKFKSHKSLFFAA